MDLELNTSTHRCLHIAEIQGMIFGLLDRHDCTQLARTCRSFYDQAMNVVWAQMGSLIPFVKCMPSEALIHVVTQSSCTPNFCQVEIEFSDFPTYSDWNLCFKHAHRVRKFRDTTNFRDLQDTKHSPLFGSTVYRLESDATEAVVQHIYQRAAEHDFAGLFPNLTTLQVESSWQDRQVHWFPKYTPFLAGRSLQALSLDFGYPFCGDLYMHSEAYSDLKDIIPMLRQAWPHLRSLQFRYLAHSAEKRNKVEDHLEVINKWIQTSSNLRSFRADLLLHSSLVKNLAVLPNLSSLYLRGDHETEPDAILHHIPYPCFPSLTDLTLVICEPDSPIPLLQALRGSETLTTVDLELQYRLKVASLVTSPAMLLEAISHIPHIQTLHVSFNEWPDESSEIALSSELLAMLFSLRHLRRLKLEGFNDVAIVDTDLIDAAEAWPKLEDIELDLQRDRDYTPFTVAPPTTLVGVQALYNGCPNIRRITITVDAQDMAPIADLSAGRPRVSEVEELFLRFETTDMRPFDDGSDIVVPRMIRLMFPQLKQLEAHAWDDEAWAERVVENWTAYQSMDADEAAAEDLELNCVH